LSADEIDMVRKHAEAYKKEGSKTADAAHTMSRAMAEVLQGRYRAYREKGIQGLAPYQMNVSQMTEPALDLVAATESMALIKERFPLYFSCLRAYPAECSSPFVHQFFWTKQIEENRPLFALKHSILDIQPEYALITERQYYISHTLDSLQVVIGCLPYRQGTLVVLLNQAFTEKVNVAVGRSIAKGFGRKIVEKKIRPIFENLRSALAH
jgi:hypothetical protein